MLPVTRFTHWSKTQFCGQNMAIWDERSKTDRKLPLGFAADCFPICLVLHLIELNYSLVIERGCHETLAGTVWTRVGGVPLLPRPYHRRSRLISVGTGCTLYWLVLKIYHCQSSAKHPSSGQKVIRSSAHRVIRSSGQKIIRSSGHQVIVITIFNIETNLRTDAQH